MEPVRDHELYQGLESALGATVATGLMERLPPAPVDRLATKDDVADVRGEVATLRADVDARFEQVDKRFEQVEGRLAALGDKADQRAERVDARFGTVDVSIARLDGKIDTLRQEMVGMHQETLATIRGEMLTAITAQSRHLVLAIVGSIVGLWSTALLLAQLVG